MRCQLPADSPPVLDSRPAACRSLAPGRKPPFRPRTAAADSQRSSCAPIVMVLRLSAAIVFFFFFWFVLMFVCVIRRSPRSSLARSRLLSAIETEAQCTNLRRPYLPASTLAMVVLPNPSPPPTTSPRLISRTRPAGAVSPRRILQTSRRDLDPKNSGVTVTNAAGDLRHLCPRKREVVGEVQPVLIALFEAANISCAPRPVAERIATRGCPRTRTAAACPSPAAR